MPAFFFLDLFFARTYPNFSAHRLGRCLDPEAWNMLSACYAFDCSTVNHSLFLNPSASGGVVNDIDWWICFITLIVSIPQCAQRMKLAFRGCNTWLVLVVLLMLKPSMALRDVDSFIVPPSILLDPQTPFHLSHRSGNSSLRRVLNSFVHQSRSSSLKKNMAPTRTCSDSSISQFLMKVPEFSVMQK